jgi:flagellar basal body L-ring protein FlgH
VPAATVAPRENHSNPSNPWNLLNLLNSSNLLNDSLPHEVRDVLLVLLTHIVEQI